MPRFSLILILSCVSHHAVVLGYGTGAPSSACESMRPGPPHGSNDAEGTSPPFTLVGKPHRSNQVKVFLKAKSGSDSKFRGFLVMAEVEGGRGQGYFIPSLESKEMVKTLDCPDLPSPCPKDATCQGTANAVTHSSSSDKKSITLIWTPPSNFKGKVVFLATVVGENTEAKSTWWKAVRSNSVKI